MRHLLICSLVLILPAVGWSQEKHAWPPLPTPVSSLGAIACDGYVYVYGGHAATTHSYDTKGVLGTFHRLKLAGGTAWEELPGGPILQGMNLAAHGGKVYRVGGMQPRNEPGDPADTHSIATAAVYDPKARQWSKLPDLPAGRSSHDLVVVNDELFVFGGWTQNGRGKKSEWLDTALSLDLTAKTPQWKSIPQPFQRRALTAAVVGTKVYVIGGLEASAAAVNRVDVYDAATQKWSVGPSIPGGRVGFSPAATTVNNRLILNTSDSSVFRLTVSGGAWEKVGESQTKRMVARLVPSGSDVILIGGASRSGNVADLELLKLVAQGQPANAGK